MDADVNGFTEADLFRDARDVLAWLEAKFDLKERCTLTAHFATSFPEGIRVRSAVIYSDGRTGLNTLAEAVLRRFGWQFFSEPVSLKELRIRTDGMSAHARVAAISRVQAVDNDGAISVN